MNSTGERSTIKDLKKEPAPHFDAGFLRQATLFSAAFAFLLLATPALAQNDILRVFGELTDLDAGKGMKGAAVIATDTLAPTSVLRAKVKVNGKFKVDLPLGRVYRVVFEAPDHAAKNVVIDTWGIPQLYHKDGFGMELKIQLPKIYPSMDYSILNQPIGVARYDATQTEIIWDSAHIAEVRKLSEGFQERYEAAKKAAGQP